ncbi:hypothetical protein PNK_p0075 (plasmid) [Candidatus Protochlamydia naegleriophila]|uniref:Uncharacterized protein n=1 Tax=Candidatus Protochlamydia naegleriophila TaxID=389348 RepID=A0A0U5EVC0_9BACT|nr:hypothetical protein PNK_p0075 [Candidatus Protochlamydia naegleriophila]
MLANPHNKLGTMTIPQKHPSYQLHNAKCHLLTGYFENPQEFLLNFHIMLEMLL